MNDNMEERSLDIPPERTTFVSNNDALRTPSIERIDKILTREEKEDKNEYYKSIFNEVGTHIYFIREIFYYFI